MMQAAFPHFHSQQQQSLSIHAIVAGLLKPLMGLPLWHFGHTRNPNPAWRGHFGLWLCPVLWPQAAGYNALVAGNIVHIFVFLGIGVGYIFRVADKVRL